MEVVGPSLTLRYATAANAPALLENPRSQAAFTTLATHGWRAS
jgi:hypothetical protein